MAEDTMAYYSQYGEDALLGKIFPRTSGWCVEVGANDGVKYSNTKHFEELGWHCVLVEPTPHLCARIKTNRTGRLFECAASASDGEMMLNIAEGYDLYSSLESRSTMAEELGKRQASIRSVSVQVRRLDDILAEAGVGSIDFISIDVEGHELSVLNGFGLSRWAPRIMLIEDKSDLAVTEVERHMVDHGYRRFYRSGGNDWYAKPGTVGAMFMLKLLLTGRVRLRGLLKVWLPRRLTHAVLIARRSALAK